MDQLAGLTVDISVLGWVEDPPVPRILRIGPDVLPDRVADELADFLADAIFEIGLGRVPVVVGEGTRYEAVGGEAQGPVLQPSGDFRGRVALGAEVLGRPGRG